MMYDSHLHQTVQLVISARKKHQNFLRHRWRIIHYGKYMFDFATLHDGPAMTGICLPSPTISISTFSHTMQARRHPSRAIQRLQGEKRYRPLVGSFQGVLEVTKITMFVQLWTKDTQQKIGIQKMQTNVVSTHFLWETIGRTSLANSKTISFLGFSTSPERSTRSTRSYHRDRDPKLRGFQHQLPFENQCFVLLVGHCHPPKKRTDQCFG